MGTDAKAVQNQKVFITLQAVMELQDRLRHEEEGFLANRKLWQETPSGTPEKAEKYDTMRIWQARVDVLSGVVKLFDLPIETKVNRG